MVTSNSKLSFDDCFDALDRALASARGIRLSFTSEGAARHFRTRLHTARRLDREANAETYEEGHPLHGTSQYDPLVVKLHLANGESTLVIEKIKLTAKIEEI